MVPVHGQQNEIAAECIGSEVQGILLLVRNGERTYSGSIL